MKEYLDPNNEYALITADDEIKGDSDWIEVPDGAKHLTKCKDHNDDEWLLFWKGNRKFCVGHDKEWFNFESGVDEYLDYWHGTAKIIWQRPTHPEPLPFIDDNPQSLNDQYAEIEQVRQHRHYFKDVSNIDEIDVYMVLKLFNVTDPCLQHIAKKALCAGRRGHKDFKKDLQDILDTAVRAVDINK